MLTAVKKHHVGPVHRADFLRRIQLRHQVPDGFEFRRADTNKREQQLPAHYVSLLAELKERVSTARYAALKAVNKELVGLYWDIGRLIAERQIDSTRGDAIVERLTRDLQAEFPGIAGFSRRNVYYMREFYLLYRDLPKVQPLVAQIGWTHNLAILQRCKSPQESEFYVRMTRKFGWTKNILIHQIESRSFEMSLLGQTNFDRALTPELRAQAHLAVRDEYTFDFLELGDEHSEREPEKALIARVEDFLRTMGGMFAFVGSQFRLEVDGDELLHRPAAVPPPPALPGGGGPEDRQVPAVLLETLHRRSKEAAGGRAGGPTASAGSCRKNWKASYPRRRKSPDCWIPSTEQPNRAHRPGQMIACRHRAGTGP